MPLTCVPTVTLVTGSMVPVAVMLFCMVVFSTVVFSNSTLSCFLPPVKMMKAATTMAMRTVPMMRFFFIAVL